MTALEITKAIWLRKEIQALQDSQWAGFDFAVADKISALKAELNSIVAYK